MEGIPEFEEIHLKFDREKIRNVLNQMEKNISDIEILCYDLKIANIDSTQFYFKSQELDLKRTVDYEDANVIIVKKRNKRIMSIFTAGLARMYIYIHIYKKNLTEEENNVLLRILQINNIKLPISSKKLTKFKLFVFLYVPIMFIGFYLFANNYGEDLLSSFGTTGVVLLFTMIFIISLPLIITSLLIYTQRIKSIQLKKKELENIEINR